ncbi:hypothetical protein [Bacillus solitudinis]|uniref:hypothetical protein n=1 Tax=Bacillus solitudinis TaxID=2014074 RepID=UPI0012FD17B7|nr:hypothetical protein [Bacillus solitudinis]
MNHEGEIKLPNDMLLNQSGTLIDDWEKEKSLISFIPFTFNEYKSFTFFLISIKPWSFITNETKLSVR